MPAWSCPRIFDDRSRYLDRFGALLALTCAAVITLSLSGVTTATAGTKGPIATAVVSVFVGLTLLLALRASGVARTWVRLADAVVGLGMTAALLLVPVTLLEQTEARATDMQAIMVTWVVLSALAPVVIVRRLLRHREVTLRTLQGAVSAYLLLPLGFYYLFLTVDTIQGADFFGDSQPPTAFMYFSLMTLTTTGYGDLAPRTDLARLVAATEAVVGQIFLVVFVALIVGILAERWRTGLPGRDSEGPRAD